MSNNVKDNDFVKASVIKKWIRATHCMLASKESMSVLNAMVKAEYEKALINAKAAGRKVVKARDFTPAEAVSEETPAAVIEYVEKKSA